MKDWIVYLVIVLSIVTGIFLTTRTDEYQIGKIVMNQARKFARENTTSIAGCRIHLLKDGVAIFFGEKSKGNIKYLARRQCSA